MHAQLPQTAPLSGESWNDIQTDYESLVVPRMTNWQSPGFAAFFPAGTSYASMLGEFYAASFGGSMFSWICSPAATELEEVVMDWLARALALPTAYLHSDPSSNGGGLVMSSASESTLTVMTAARDRMLDAIAAKNPNVTIALNWRQKEAVDFVVLGSETSHSSVAKAARILNLQYIAVRAPASNGFRMTGPQLMTTIQQCTEQGLTPVFVAATLGTKHLC